MSGLNPGDIGQEVHRKVKVRMLAMIMAMVVLSSLDRTNISFAALRMNQALGLDKESFGFGASIFFVGYLAFQIPSMMLLKKIGARRWIFLTVTVWGVLAAAMAFIQNATQFYALRLLIGVAESGFAPGTMYYISRWLPSAYRGRSITATMLAIPVSVIIGAPISGVLLGIHAVDFPGWRWMFLLEGLPTVLLGVFALFWFVDRPRDAKWLTPEEKDWVERGIAADDAEAQARSGAKVGWAPIMANPLIWCCAGVWFAFVTGGNGIIFWLPQAIKAIAGRGDFETSLLSALPWVAVAIGMVVNAWRSDKIQERFYHVGLAALLGAVGLIGAALTGGGLPALACLVVGGLGLGACQAVYWTIPLRLLSGGQAANGVAMINLTGNIGSLMIPTAIGFLIQRTGSFNTPIYVMATLLMIAALLLIPIAKADRRRSAAALAAA